MLPNAPLLPANIVLIGFMGSGKSSIGRLLAAQLERPFLDTDALIVEAAGMAIPEIFAQKGEAIFRAYETRTLDFLIQHTRQEKAVIATGGGIVISPAHLPLLHQLGFVVGLQAREEVIFERVSRNKNRPLLQTPNPRETISQLLAERAPLYAQAADFSLDTSAKPHPQVVEEILEEAQRRFGENREDSQHSEGEA